MTKEELAVAATFLVAELRKEIAGSANDSAESFRLWLLQEDAVPKRSRQRRKQFEKKQHATHLDIFRFHAILVGLVKIEGRERSKYLKNFG